MTDLGDADLAGVLRALADAVVIADADGSIIFWNDAAAGLFGWSAAEAIGQSLDVIIPERQRDRHWEGYRRVMATGHTEYGGGLLEVPGMHKDGSRISLAFTVTLLQRDGEPPWAIAAVLRNDTERFQERRQLRERIAQLEPQ